MKKKIAVTCQGAATAKLEDLLPLQGGLKKLSAERYKKLKRSLLRHGFSFPFFAWKNGQKLFILDGHQRELALKRMLTQGYEIPPLPIIYIDAKDEKEAREKILLLSSQYGEITEDSLLKFLDESSIELDDLLDTIELPEVNLEKLSARLEGDFNGQQHEDDLSYQYQVIVECKDENDQLKLIDKLEKQKYNCRALIL